MKSIFLFLKRIHAYILLVALSICTVIIFQQKASNQELKLQLDNNTKAITAATKVLDRYTDKEGGNHIVIQDNILTKDQIKELQKNDKYITDTLAKALNIAANRITEYTKVVASLEASHLKAKIDTNTKVATYVDKYAHLTYNPRDTTFGLKYNLELIQAGYNKRMGFLGLSRTKVIDLYSPDTRVTIGGVDRYTLQAPDDSYGLKIQGKTFYNLTTGVLLAGPGVELGLGKLTLIGNYLYNSRSQDWQPVAGAKLTLLNIK